MTSRHVTVTTHCQKVGKEIIEFSPGTIFAIEIRHTAEVSIPLGFSLKITSASISPGTKDRVTTFHDNIISLQYRQGKSKSVSICALNFHQPTVSGLDLTSKGPINFVLSKVGNENDIINVVGSIHRCSVVDSGDKDMIPLESHVDMQPLKRRKHLPEDSTDKQIMNQKNPEKKDVLDESEESIEKENEIEAKEERSAEIDVPSEVPLSKRQRRKRAKKRQREAEENKNQSVEGGKGNGLNPLLVSNKRFLNGVQVNDITLGEGITVKPGRKVSIHYKGSFPDGKVFDKNQNMQRPLTFRQGTGQVVRGLEIGLEGMRVGGEREITIPPELGYGKTGSGKVIPPNMTLVFLIKLIAA